MAASQTSRARFGLSDLAFAAVTVAYAVFVTLYYYRFFFIAGDEFDLDIFAHLIWRNPAFSYFPSWDYSFFHAHLTPTLYPLALASFVFPGSQALWFALFQSGVYGVFGLIFLMFWRRAMPGGAPLRDLLGAGICGLFLISGVFMNSLWIGHYEFAITAGAAAVLWALATGRRRWAALALILTLGLREDAGFHVFSWVAPVVALKLILWREGWERLRDWIVVGAAAFAYSVLAFAFMKYGIGSAGIFEVIFSGDPAWAHLSPAHFQRVAARHWAENRHLWAPALILLAAAAALRRPVYALGALAPLPWTLLHAFAVNADAAVIANYKAFPWAMTAIWPLIARVLEEAGERSPARAATVAGLCGLLVLSGQLAPDERFAPTGPAMRARLFAHPDCFADMAAQARFRAAVAEARDALGTVRVASGVHRLARPIFTEEEHILWYGGDPVARIAAAKPDTIIYQANARAAPVMTAAARRLRLPERYAVVATNIRIASRRWLAGDPALGPLLRKDPGRTPLCPR